VASIFISYRREDAAGHAGRLCDRLTARFGADRVFMDIQDISPGQNFATSIEDTIATCDCVIALIGPHWLESIRQRASSGNDYLRREIGAGLRRKMAVIPVLVGDARMPAAADLPADLAELSFLNAIEIRDESFDRDVVELETFLANQLRVGKTPASATSGWSPRRLMIAVPIVLLAAAIGGFFAFRPAPSLERETPPPPAAPKIDGDWIADMQNAAQQRYRIRLHFAQVGDRITGLVRYPTGDGPIQDGELKGTALTFSTSHMPQFESSRVTTRFLAEVTGDRIRLTATYDGGMATGFATRAAPSGSPER
jgi:hypothetical protein